ncbi:(2Fe-2S)-binding protein [Rhodoferax sp. 4810]|uniref:(2Fe-2S)-binding protein n=1 Tax=Thiospirillum jenense TaxID=1653858 RepID=A0A839HC53_9GAMM|nr:2Fe-2S iron-sulfur cluster-binding protein [Thiospirillum jenense]MBB1073058.1 (2Fe-2S)-binding protein [Rhodoferax jenense]MBB1125006.1 (2Fe-2S)-binding protein [Thiospirillum jenense]
MALVTFSNPDHKDKTVYAVAGSHTDTLLKLAKENKVPVHFDCQDGECGHCVVRVTSVDNKARMGYYLTDKEQTVLKQLGKLTQDQIDQLHVDDMPSEWRLACQMIVRDEDILVEY